MEYKQYVGRLETKFAGADGDQRSISGYASVFGNVDLYGDIVAPGAFAASLARHKAAGTSPAMLWGHDARAIPIGIWGTLSEDANGLAAEGTLLNTSTGNDAYIAAKAGAVSGLSIGYVVTDSDMSTVNGRSIRIIKEVELLEISLVVFPANTEARVESVKHMEEATMNTEIKLLLAEIKALHESNTAEIRAIRAAIGEAKSSIKDMGEDEDGDECDCDVDDDCECDDSEDMSDEEAKSALAAMLLELKAIGGSTNAK